MGKATGAKFSRAMRRTHKIYMPDMLHDHNELLQAAFSYGGYDLAVIPEYRDVDALALQYVNDSYCFPAVSIISQMIAFLRDQGEQPERLAFMEPQAGGICRAGNIYNLMIDVLGKAGYGDVPVISLNMTGEERHPGFVINHRMIFGCVAAVCYADLLMTLTQQLKPYEKQEGTVAETRRQWMDRLAEDIRHGRNLSNSVRKTIYQQMIDDFKKIPLESKSCKKVGIVGEIYMKFSPIGNQHLEELLREFQCDYRLGGFLNYAIYVVFTEMENARLQRKNKGLLKGYAFVWKYLCRVQKDLTEILLQNGMKHDADFPRMRSLASQIISDGYNIGDGWLIAGEIMDLIQQGYDRILILHPFGCLVSHVGGRGIIKKIKTLYPQVRIQSIEFDYEQSRALRESRILLAIS